MSKTEECRRVGSGSGKGGVRQRMTEEEEEDGGGVWKNSNPHSKGRGLV